MKNDPCWKNYKMVGEKKKNGKTVPDCVPKNESFSFTEWLKNRDEDLFVDLNESKKPYKGFDPKKNDPEGGLKPSYAKKLGIHAGIETKREAERKGGVSKMSEKTQARRKSFCSRMCGMRKHNTSAEKAHDPKSKINAALRVWKCRC